MANGILEREQKAAIRDALEMAIRLQEQHPEIAQMYEALSHREIAGRLELDKNNGGSMQIAIVGVGLAIRGLDEDFLGVPAFQGLITDKEKLKGLEEKHRKRGGEIGGGNAVKWKKGIHNPEGWTREDYQRVARDTAKERLRAQGKEIWGDEERQEVYKLSQTPEFQYAGGARKGLPMHRKIVLYLNSKYHEGKSVRNREGVRRMIRLERMNRAVSIS